MAAATNAYPVSGEKRWGMVMFSTLGVMCASQRPGVSTLSMARDMRMR